MSSIVVSFHPNDSEFVIRLLKGLASRGHSVRSITLQQAMVHPGRDATIPQEGVHLAVVTTNYLAVGEPAETMLQQIRVMAVEASGRVIVLKPDAVELPDQLASVETLDFGKFDEGMDKLLRTLGPASPPETTAAASDTPAADNAGSAAPPPPPPLDFASNTVADPASASGAPDAAATRTRRRPVRKAGPARPQVQQAGPSPATPAAATDEMETTDAPVWAGGRIASREVVGLVDQAFFLAALDEEGAVTPEHLAWAFVERGRSHKESHRTPWFVWETIAKMAGGVRKATAVVGARFPALAKTGHLPPPTSVAGLDDRAKLVIEAAALIGAAVSAHDEPSIAARHLLAALIVLRFGPGDGGPFTRVFNDFSVDASRFREEFRAFVRAVRPADDHEAWKEVLARWRSLAGLRSFAEETAKARPATVPSPPPPADPRKRTRAATRQQKAPDAPPPLTVAPASTSDQPSAEDHLGFKPYVDAVAQFLRNPGTLPPLTLSIEGEWGSGKSSFMRQLRAELDADPKAVTVWFNPWRHDREEAVWAAFALEFLRGVSARLPRLERWRGHYRLLRTRFSWRDGWLDVVRAGAVAVTAIIAIAILFYLSVAGTGVVDAATRALGGEHADHALLSSLLGVGGVGASLAVAVSLGKQAKAFVGNPLRFDLKRYVRSPDYQSRISFIEHFHEDFGKIVKSYVGERRVYVFIDDLDRCEVPKAADLMQALNLMMGVEEQPIFFVLGMDREKIAASLAVKFKELLPFITADAARSGAAHEGDAALRGLEYGSEFVEKFVQVSFLVPQPRLDDVARLLGKLSERASPGAAPLEPIPQPAPDGGATVASTREAIQSQEASVTIPLQDGGSARLSPVVAKINADGTAEIAARMPPPPPEPTPAERAVQRRLTAEVAVDSARLRTIAVVVAPALDQNPRRIKQFVNVFRLRAYIAIRTGLIKPDAERAAGDLTFEKLGKFVAIGLRWPLLLANLEEDPELLTRLQKRAMQQPSAAAQKPATGAEAFWASRGRLRELLRAGLVDADGKGVRGAAAAWSLADLDADLLLQVAAPAPRPTPASEPVPA